MKNAFYVNLKALFVINIFKFLSTFLNHVDKQLDQKVNFKIFNVTTWFTNNCNIHVLPNISRGKGNQKIKFGQLIEYIIRNVFLKKYYTKCGGKTIPRPFSKKLKLSISLNQQFKVVYSSVLLYAKLRAIKIY